MKLILSILLGVMMSVLAIAQNPFIEAVDKKADEIEEQVITWRRHFHANPELSNREFETGEIYC